MIRLTNNSFLGLLVLSNTVVMFLVIFGYVPIMSALYYGAGQVSGLLLYVTDDNEKKT